MLTDRSNAKGLQLFYAAVPLLLSFIISIISFFAAVFIRGFYYHTNIAEENAADDGIVYLINYGMQIIIFGFWYLTLRKREDAVSQEQGSDTPKKTKNKEKASAGTGQSSAETARKKTWNPVAYWAKRLPLLIVLGYALQLAVSGIIAALSAAFPELFSSYKELIQSLTGDGVDWLTLLAVSFLAPIGEEFLFRGVTLHFARKALPVKWAIIFQAVLFGIYHLNLVQFVYAVAVGLLLGMLAEQAGSVIPGIVLHMIINLTSYLVPSIFLDNIPKAVFTAVISIAVAVPCCILLLKRKKRR